MLSNNLPTLIKQAPLYIQKVSQTTASRSILTSVTPKKLTSLYIHNIPFKINSLFFKAASQFSTVENNKNRYIKTVSSAKIEIVDFIPEKVITHLSIPFPSLNKISPFSQNVEKEVIKFAKKYSLYKNHEKSLEGFKFAYLIGSLNSDLNHEGINASSKQFTTLFAFDDILDEHKNLKFKELQKLIDRMISVSEGQEIYESDSLKVKALKEIGAN